ncbi:MAG: hypothetical protein LBH56_00230, partial [Coriobacteriales bacterium]|nr:hypothetical protein [Coriobacteriales bacterium]
GFSHIELLKPFIHKGEYRGIKSGALEAQQTARASLAGLHPANKRLLNPHSYPVGVEPSLLDQRNHMLRQARSR